MLETVIEIGRILRASPGGLAHHRYVKRAPVHDPKTNPVAFWAVSAAMDGSFVFNPAPLIDETAQRRLFYLNYKQSDADSTKPFVYGDVYRVAPKGKKKEFGNFLFGDPGKGSWMGRNSFDRAEGVDAIPTDRVSTFRSSFRRQISNILEFLDANENAYIHFDFAGKAWHEMEEVAILNDGLVATFFSPRADGFVMNGFLYKALAADRARLPGFLPSRAYASRVFKDKDEALDLLYGINYASSATVRKNDFKVVVLPRGDGLTAEVLERFFGRRTRAEPGSDAIAAEEDVVANLDDAPNSSETPDDELLSFALEESAIAQFDCVFSKAGGTKPDVDMVELSGIQRSNLVDTAIRIRAIREIVEAARDAEHFARFRSPSSNGRSISITDSFREILGDQTRAKKKYQSHLFRVVPQILSGTYTNDAVLLPAFIEKTEYSIRGADAHFFSDAKFNLEFLFRIRDDGEERLMDIKQSPSYRIGLALGAMSQPLGRKIKSFDKNYAGLLSRRITTVADVRALANDVNQKLVMHEVAWVPSVREARELMSEAIGDLTGPYDRDECAFGFFESYFAPIKPRGDDSSEDGSEARSPNTI